MTRRWLSPAGMAAAFAAVAALVVGGLAWVTVSALRVEQAQREATARADRLNRERLALWRLDAFLLPVLALEGNRPFGHYTALTETYPAVRFGANGSDVAQLPSPLLSTELPDWMLLHFQFDPSAGWQSPQVIPVDTADRLRAEPFNLTLANATPERSRRLGELVAAFPPEAAVNALAERAEPVEAATLAMPDRKSDADTDGKKRRAEAVLEGRAAAPPTPAPTADGPVGPMPQSATNQAPSDARNETQFRYELSKQAQGYNSGLNDFAGNTLSQATPAEKLAELRTDVAAGPSRDAGLSRRERALTEEVSKDRGAGMLEKGDAGAATPMLAAAPDAAPAPFGGIAAAPARPAPPPAPIQGAEPAARPRAARAAPDLRPPAVHLGPLRPRWLSAADGREFLVFLRAAKLEDRTVYQGVWLDWPRLRETLTARVADLFPDAVLTPIRRPDEIAPGERAMTALPAELDPGPEPELTPAGRTPLRVGLLLTWAAALVALAAVGVGGAALVALSERRIRFVSAVTHELRTPLTSLRLYLDLLAGGLVSDEKQQKEYIATLAAESERLHRLIENVLDFARLEKRAARAHVQPHPVADLLDEVRRTWADRCLSDGMELVVISTLPDGQQVATDPRVATQVIGNLVDNARKYSKGAADGRIWVWAKPGGHGTVLVEVEDRGPGIPPRDRRGLFRPFRRGTDAGERAGGAGLGLALARQWAELLGGRLSFRPADGGTGACFRLELPAA